MFVSVKCDITVSVKCDITENRGSNRGNFKVILKPGWCN